MMGIRMIGMLTTHGTMLHGKMVIPKPMGMTMTQQMTMITMRMNNFPGMTLKMQVKLTSRSLEWLLWMLMIHLISSSMKASRLNMEEAVTLFARTEGILLDPVYTGKAAAGLVDLVRKGEFPEGSNVAFLHTGGAPSLYHYLPLDEDVSGIAGAGTQE